MTVEEARRRGRRPKQHTKAAQINIRMEPSLKEAGDTVLDRLGVTPSEAVRALYEYLVSEQDLPEGLPLDRKAVARDHWAREGADLVHKLLQDGVSSRVQEESISHG